jgi:uracil-DNA glycosylase
MPLSPEIWPEDVIPVEAVDCLRCSLSQQRSRIIWGEGNPEAPIFVLLDNPGAREDKLGNSFVCGTRQTLQKAVQSVGLGKDDLYITYVLRCRPVKKYEKEQCRSMCMKYFKNQVHLKVPNLIVCLGNVAAQSYLEDPGAEVKTLRGKISFYKGVATAFSYHPLAVRRRPVLSRIFLEDWELVAGFLKSSIATR